MTPNDHLQALFEFLRFPSISTQSNCEMDLVRCAEWLNHRCTQAGLESQVYPTAGYPIVVAKTPIDPAKRTVLIYGHYDVQPPEPLAEWEGEPFEPVVKNGKIYARGASDNKGQILAHLLGVIESIRRGTLPCNVIFLIEGEEEIGSPHLEAFVQSHRDLLQCDVVAISDSGMAADGYPTLAYALRGISAMEIVVRGPGKDLHSGVYGGAVANPVTALARLLASLHHSNGKVAVEGFYDAVNPLEAWERDAAKNLPSTEEDLRVETGAPELFGEEGYTALERIGARPTAEVNGIGGGYQGEGTKTVLPKEAFAKLTFRIVPDQNPEKILDLVTTHLQTHLPPGVTLEIRRGHSGEAFFSNPNSPDGLAAQRALQTTFGRSPALLREGGTIPIVAVFQKIFRVDVLLLALASPDCNAHSPNESFPVANFESGIRLNQNLLAELAAVPQPEKTGDYPHTAAEAVRGHC